MFLLNAFPFWRVPALLFVVAASLFANSQLIVTPSSLQIPSGGGLVAVDLTALPNSTTWSVTIPSADTWLTVVGPREGVGNSTLQFSAVANVSGTPRLTTVRIGAVSLNVIQLPNEFATQVKLNRDSLTFGELGGTSDVAILMNRASGLPPPVADVPWISLPILPPGTTVMRIVVEQNPTTSSRVGRVTYGDASVSVVQAPLRDGRQNLIVGTVRDRGTGLPIPGARVFFYGSGYGSTTADSNGNYRFTGTDLNSSGGALSGNVYVGAQGYFEAIPLSIPDLGAQSSLPLVRDVTLRPGGVIVRGVVRDSSSSAGIAGVSISFNRTPMSTYRGGGTTEGVTTAADGSYVIDSSYFNGL